MTGTREELSNMQPGHHLNAGACVWVWVWVCGARAGAGKGTALVHPGHEWRGDAALEAQTRARTCARPSAMQCQPVPAPAPAPAPERASWHALSWRGQSVLPGKRTSDDLRARPPAPAAVPPASPEVAPAAAASGSAVTLSTTRIVASQAGSPGRARRRHRSAAVKPFESLRLTSAPALTNSLATPATLPSTAS